jgi:hypothetical protein
MGHHRRQQQRGNHDGGKGATEHSIDPDHGSSPDTGSPSAAHTPSGENALLVQPETAP